VGSVRQVNAKIAHKRAGTARILDLAPCEVRFNQAISLQAQPATTEQPLLWRIPPEPQNLRLFFPPSRRILKANRNCICHPRRRGRRPRRDRIKAVIEFTRTGWRSEGALVEAENLTGFWLTAKKGAVTSANGAMPAARLIHFNNEVSGQFAVPKTVR
jgi:hypothetical protein